MARTYIFVVMAIALTMLLFLSGITSDSGSFSSKFISDLIHGEDTNNSDLWLQIIVAIGIVTAGATASSLAGNSSTGIAIANGILVFFLVNIVQDYVHVINKAKEYCGIDATAICADWVYWVISAIFITIIGGLLFTLYEWVTGVD